MVVCAVPASEVTSAIPTAILPVGRVATTAAPDTKMPACASWMKKGVRVSPSA